MAQFCGFSFFLVSYVWGICFKYAKTYEWQKIPTAKNINGNKYKWQKTQWRNLQMAKYTNSETYQWQNIFMTTYTNGKINDGE